MKPEVVVIQHGAPEGPGAIAEALRSRDVIVRVVRVDQGEPVPVSLGAAGLVVMGGPMGVNDAERYPHLKAGVRLLQQALAADCPVLGICLGSQDALAGALETEGITADRLLREADRVLPSSRRVGTVVFGRWAEIVVRRV